MAEEKLILELFGEISRKIDLLLEIVQRDYGTGYKKLNEMLNETLDS